MKKTKLPQWETELRQLYKKFSPKEQKWLENRRYWKDSCFLFFLDEPIYKSQGFIELFDWREGYNGYYLNFGILSECRGEGWLSKGMRKMIKCIGKDIKNKDWIYWGVYKDNELSIKLAKKYGFIYEKDWRKTQELYKQTFGDFKKQF